MPQNHAHFGIPALAHVLLSTHVTACLIRRLSGLVQQSVLPFIGATAEYRTQENLYNDQVSRERQLSVADTSSSRHVARLAQTRISALLRHNGELSNSGWMQNFSRRQ
jgi:hypothetical protein